MSASRTKKRPGGSAVKVPIGLPVADGSQKAHRYWVGSLPECPIQNPSAGGVTFMRFRGNPNLHAADNSDASIMAAYDDQPKGIYVHLTDEQVEVVKRAVALRVVRIAERRNDMALEENAPDMTAVRPKVKRAQVFMVDGPHYQPQKNDVPFASLVYMHRMDGMTIEALDNFPPESMAGEVVDIPAKEALAPETAAPAAAGKET